MALQDKNVVRTAADLERKYNFAKILGLTTNVEKNAAELLKVENELNNMLNSLVINLGDVLDTQSSISLWFYEGVPTTSNEPYTDWATPSDHYGDFYYNQNTGYVYKFTDSGWIIQEDENLIQAMAMTNVEIDVEQDHERQVFFSEPTPPYDNGDWWILEDGTLMICQIARATGSYQEDDFIIANRYTPTIASAEGDIITIKKGQVIKMSDTFASFTDLATGGSTTIAGENISTGSIKSNNYVANTSGTKINLTDGTIDTKDFKVSNTGSITATGGKIAEYTISGAKLVGTNVGLSGKSGDGWAFWSGSDTPSEAPFRVGHTGALRATNADITGNITATSGSFTGTVTSSNGTIGGWSLSSNGFSNNSGFYVNNLGVSNVYTMSDILVCKMILTGVVSVDSGTPEFAHFDVNNDGVIDSQDLLAIRNLLNR